MSMFDAIGQMFGIGESAGDKASAAQAAAAGASNATMEKIYNQNRADQEPWRVAGADALGKMQDPSFQKNFTMADFQADPGYAFRMQEGQKALERSAAAKGGLMGGAQMKALTSYGQNMGAQEYQNAYNRFNNDASTRYGRLATLAGYGQQANSQNAASGMNYGNNVAQTQMGLGNAQASNIIGQANMNNQQLQQGVQMGAMMFCDRRLKTGIEKISAQELAEMKASLTAYKFKYRDEMHGKGDFIGVMAQDLQKTKLGKTLVFEDENNNLKVDLGRVAMLFLATMAEA